MKSTIHRLLQIVFLSLLSITLISAQGWERTFGGNGEDEAFDVVATVDGGYATVGFSETPGRVGTNVTLVKTNEQGETEWMYSYGEIGDDLGFGLIQDSNGDYLIVGQTDGFGNGNNDILLLKVDSKGTLLWQKAYGGPGNDQGWSITPNREGGYYLVGRKEFDGNADLYLFKIDQSGELIWDRNFGGDKTDEGFSVIETSTGDVVAVGVTKSFINQNTNSSDSYFIKVDANGETIIEAKFGNLERDRANSVVETLDGGFAITGIATDKGDAFLLQLDSNGNEIWSKTYGDPIFREEGSDIQLAPDGGFIIAGSNELTDRNSQIYLLRTDREGNELWNSLYGGSGSNIGRAVTNTPDGGFVIVGNYDINKDPNSLLPLYDIYMAKTNPTGNVFNNIIKGNVFRDINANCTLDNGEKVLEDWLVQLKTGNDIVYATTNENGEYEVALEEGNYNVSLVVLNNAWDVCQNYNVNFITSDTIELDFAARATVADCPVVVADISAPFLEPCRTTDYTVSLCNRGVSTADDTYIDIQFDRDLKINYSTLPWADHTNNTYRFNIGDLAVEECGDFKVNVTVDCDALVGKSHCVEAYASPNALCIPPPPTWNGASIRIDGECIGDSVRFVIQNIGEGDMTAPSDFIVIIDDFDIRQGYDFQIPSNGSETVTFPADGSTIRVIADQPAGHPYGETASTAIEGCPFGKPFSTGFLTLFSDSDDLPFYASDCQENKLFTGIIDMTPSPKGVGAEKMISATDDIEYHIYFQNTGSDTVSRVILRDTLSSIFDITTVVPGASSHPYEYEVTGEGILTFTFQNIDLPSTAINDETSYGFVKFRVSQKLNTPKGAVIENTASVTFDFGAPIASEMAFHTIGGETVSDYIEVSTDVDDIVIPGVSVDVFPNPFTERATIELIGLGATPNITFQLFDVTGRLVQADSHSISRFDFYPNQLSEGLYFFSILSEGQLVTSGKVFIR